MTDLASLFDRIDQSEDPSTSLQNASYAGLDAATTAALEQAGCEVYRGKVREVIRRGDQLLMLHTDRLSAFDRHIGLVPGKGLMLATLSEYWAREAAKLGPCHLIDQPHPLVLRTRACEPIKAEVIVRGYLAGSMQRAYLEGRREFCGESLPDGLARHAQLPRPILTPTTKAAAYEHDEEASPEELFATGVTTPPEWGHITKRALALFARGQEIYRSHGWLLVDTKYEFGRGSDGQVYLIDEAHTPDSSRFWRLASYAERIANGEQPEMFDKEVIRQHLMDLGFQGHGDVPAVEPTRFTALARTYLGVVEQLLGRGPQTTTPPALGQMISWLT